MIYDYIDTDKKYDDVFLNDNDGVFALFKLNTSCYSHKMPVWVINSYHSFDNNNSPKFQDWQKIAFYINNNKNYIDYFLRYTQKDKNGNFFIDHRAIGVYKQSPKCFCGKTQYPDWFLNFLNNGADINLIPHTAPIVKPIIKRK